MTVILITLLCRKTKVLKPLIRYFAQFGFNAILNEELGLTEVEPVDQVLLGSNL